MQGLYRSLVTCLLIMALFSTTVSAQANKAILYPGQGVKLNGNGLQTSSAVLSGDTIQTGGGGAQLTGHGLIIQLEPNSALQYGDMMILSCGGVVVSSDGNSVQASDTRVVPLNGAAKFQMVDRGGKLTISVHSGTVRVVNDQVSTLLAGQSVEIASPDGCPVATATNTPAAAASHARGKWITLGAAGGGAVAAGIFVSERKPSSPSAP